MTVYLGKRDFVDHLDHVDPVGESAGQWTGGWVELCDDDDDDDTFSSFLPTDGVILVDPEYLKDRKGEPASSFRSGATQPCSSVCRLLSLINY